MQRIGSGVGGIPPFQTLVWPPRSVDLARCVESVGLRQNLITFKLVLFSLAKISDDAGYDS